MKKENKNKIYIQILIFFGSFPIISSAQGLVGLLTSFGGLLRRIPPVIFGISVIYFFWGCAQFILNAGNDKLREDGKNKMLWGVVILTVYVSIYGILNAMQYLVGI